MILFNVLDIRQDLGKWKNRHSFSTKAQRHHFEPRQDILNLSRKVNHLSKIRHKNESKSVHQMVSELKQEDYNPILCYKPQGTVDPTLSKLSKESFILAIQTEFQRDLYQQYAQTVLCIDSTHKTNSHDFKLISVFVPDEYGEGQLILRHPCCHITINN